jgi:hypothetical protein
MKSTKSGIAIALVSAALLGGCATIAEYPEQPPLTTGGSVEISRISIHVVTDLDELQKKCLNRSMNYIVYACAYPGLGYPDPKKSVCTIFAFMPENREDAVKVALLGHEAWHCFGAAHVNLITASAYGR